VFSDLNDDDVASADEDVTPGAYSFETFTGDACTDAKPCSWSGSGTTWRDNRQQNAVQAFYLANRFHKHLAEAPINFTDRSFEGSDRLLLQTDDGAATGPDSDHLDNANMYTPPDGTSPVMQMYLWGSARFRAVNGGDDASILYHEYTHGLSNRLIHDAGGAGALNLPQAGAMGEGWSDWYAKDFLVSQFPGLDGPGNGDVHMGVYTDAVANSIRKQGLDCPVVGCSGLTYGDFGKIVGYPEVHYDGEIWAQTLWDLRKAVESDAAERLVTQAMRLSPPEPSFLDERNAILAADAAAGGTLRDGIWTVFAARGMGYFASTTGSDDTSPVEDFSLPPDPGDPHGTIAGRITDASSGAPLADAKVTLGSLVAEADADGRYTLADVAARAYSGLVVSAPGYDRLQRSATVNAGTTTTLDADLRRNWAAQSGGASVTGSAEFAELGCGPLAAIDQLAGTTWSTPAAAGGKAMVVTLPAAVDVDHFEIDPAEGCGDGSNAAARDVKIETSTNGASWTVAATNTFGFGDRQRMNVVSPTAGASGVRYVRVTIQSTLGGAAYMDMSEFGVYSAGPAPTPTTPAVPTPAPSATPTPTPRPSFTLSASGKRSIKFRVRCPRACVVRASLTVDAKTARKLRLGSSRTAGSLRRSLKAGSTTLTVRLVARAKPKASFRATLTVRSGSVVARRRVTIRR
jgi:hypothetical protein